MNNVGRPKDTIESLPEGWYNDILAMFEEGASDVEVKALIFKWRGSFSNDLWCRWMAEEPQFSETIKIGKLLSEAWWNREGRTNLKDKDFSYTGWYMNMKNRFGWMDKQQTELNAIVETKQIPLTKEQIDKAIENL